MIDNLHVHYITAIYNTAFNIVSSFVNESNITETSDNSGKNPYKTLCQAVNHDVFIPCLAELCKSLFKIVLSYYQLVKYHNFQENDSGEATIEDNMNKQYIKQKLDHNLVKIWDDVQRKVSSLLLNADLASYKFDQFVQVLSVVHRLMQVGEEFCGGKSEDLQESIRKQSGNYFSSYHVQRLEELKIFLENESWEICPVKPTFEILQLQEFKGMRWILKNYKTKAAFSTNSPDCSSSNHSQDGSSIVGNYFMRYAEHGTPFDSKLDETIIEEDILISTEETSCYFSDDSEEESEELRRDYVDEYDENVHKTREKKHNLKAPVLTNTTLTVLRQMGKYLQMSRLMKPIAYNIIMQLNELFDFYLYTVHSFFTSDLVIHTIDTNSRVHLLKFQTITSNSLYSKELTTTLKKISDNLIAEAHFSNDNDQVNIEKVQKPYLSPIVDLTKPEKLHGLAERIVAVESLIFLAKQYELLQGYLESLIPPANKKILQQFYTQVSELRFIKKLYCSIN